MNLNTANLITEQENLHLVDGGKVLLNDTIIPILQPSCAIVNKNSADVDDLRLHGNGILTT